MPRVSVVIPTHNRAHLIGPSIASVLQQTFQDFEILVVDDASTDSTEEVVRSMADSRIRYLKHATNRHVSAARNTGILNSRGDLVAFLDDDDEWLPTKLELQVGLLDVCAPVVGGIYTGFVTEDRSVGKVLWTITPTARGHILHELCRLNCIGTASTVVLRKNSLEEVGLFDESIEYGEEYDLWIRLARRFDFTFLAEPLVRYSVHGKQLSTKYEGIIRGSERKLEKYREFFASYPESLAQRYLTLGAYRCYAGDMRNARASFLEGIRVAPWVVKQYVYLSLSLLGATPFKRTIGRGLPRAWAPGR